MADLEPVASLKKVTKLTLYLNRISRQIRMEAELVVRTCVKFLDLLSALHSKAREPIVTVTKLSLQGLTTFPIFHP